MARSNSANAPNHLHHHPSRWSRRVDRFRTAIPFRNARMPENAPDAVMQLSLVGRAGDPVCNGHSICGLG